jgi:CBS domain-containing protein
MLASEIMTRNPQVVFQNDPLWRAAELMRYHAIGCVPVLSDEETRDLVGILTDRDIAVRCVARKHAINCLTCDHMTARPLRTVTLHERIEDVMRVMEEHHVHHVPVLSDDGALVGIISEHDLLRRCGYRNPLLVERSLERMSGPATVGVF